MYKIFIWGIGERTAYCIKNGYYADCEIVGFIQTTITMTKYMSIPVITPQEAREKMDSVEYIVINNQYFWQILNTCCAVGIPEEKLVLTDNLQEPPFDSLFSKLAKISPDFYDELKHKPLRIVKGNEMDFVDSSRQIGIGRYNTSEYRAEYLRYRTFELIARELREYKIEGEMAELGVFNGSFSSLINTHFPDRKLYLFDTFEGFDEKEAEREISEGRCDENFVKAHRKPSMEVLMQNLTHFESCILCKGFFPNTITEEASQEIYAFVSIDVDFEESTYQGLKFFYPRLAEGGYIFLHDYNTYYLEGVRTAVQRFEKDMGICLRKVPIADRAGTLIITK